MQQSHPWITIQLYVIEIFHLPLVEVMTKFETFSRPNSLILFSVRGPSFRPSELIVRPYGTLEIECVSGTPDIRPQVTLSNGTMVEHLSRFIVTYPSADRIVVQLPDVTERDRGLVFRLAIVSFPVLDKCQLLSHQGFSFRFRIPPTCWRKVPTFFNECWLLCLSISSSLFIVHNKLNKPGVAIIHVMCSRHLPLDLYTLMFLTTSYFVPFSEQGKYWIVPNFISAAKLVYDQT